jgi:hypothetical protein
MHKNKTRRSRFRVLSSGFVFWFGAAFTFVVQGSAFAEVTKVTITTRATVADGQAFGSTGPYEKLVGTIEFALDPADRHNKPIVDLEHAVKGPDGKVHFTSDLFVLRPVDSSKGNGVLLFEISNRGTKGMLGRFNRARSNDDPTTAEQMGASRSAPFRMMPATKRR